MNVASIDVLIPQAIYASHCSGWEEGSGRGAPLDATLRRAVLLLRFVLAPSPNALLQADSYTMRVGTEWLDLEL